MPSNGEKKPETHDKPHPFEQRPKPDVTKGLGQTAVRGATNDKNKK